MNALRVLVNGLWRLGTQASPLPVFAFAVSITLSIQLHRSIHDVDIFWQILLGNITLNTGLLQHEPLLAHQQHQPYVAFYWLGQCLYALVHRLGEWPLLRVVDAILWLGGFAIVARQCLQQHRYAWPAVIAFGIGVYAAMPFASLRLQSFGVLGFGLLIVLMRSAKTPRSKLLLAVPLLALWQNLHPSVVVAVVYLGLRTAGVLLNRVRGSQTESPWLATGLTVLASVTIVLTPVGFEIIRLSAYNGEISKHLGITEWQPLWAYDWQDYGRDQASQALLATVVLLGITLVLAPRRLMMADIAPLLGFTVMTVYCHRFILLWGVVVIPVAASCVNALCESWTAIDPPASPNRTRLRRGLALAAFVIAIAVPLRSDPAPFAEYYPFAAVKALQSQPVRGVVFCDYFWGGVVSYSGWPDWQPTHDGRYFIIPKDAWDHYFNTIAKGRVTLAHLESEYQPAAWLLRKGTYDGLIAQLRESPRWTLLFDDHQSIVFVKTNPE